MQADFYAGGRVELLLGLTYAACGLNFRFTNSEQSVHLFR
jgi:hypothetical protein